MNAMAEVVDNRVHRTGTVFESAEHPSRQLVEDEKTARSPSLLRIHCGALVVMVLGCSGVLALVLAMNGLTAPPTVKETSKQTSFTIQPKPRQPKTKRVRPKPRRSQRQKMNRSLKPTVLSAISGPSFGIPTLEASDMLNGAHSGLRPGGNLIMTEDAVDDPPTARSRVAPTYPERARARGVEGFVVLNLLINSRGDVENVRVLEASPPATFENAAKSAVRGWKFDPATYKGEAVRVWAKQVVRFNLS